MVAKILCVEAEPMVAKQMRETLQAAYDIVEAIDGQDAWVRIGEKKPDVVVTAANVPRLNGWDLIRRMHMDMDEETRKIPSIIIVDKKGFSARMIAGMMGISAILQKPLDSKQLRQAVDAALRSKGPQ